MDQVFSIVKDSKTNTLSLNVRVCPSIEIEESKLFDNIDYSFCLSSAYSSSYGKKESLSEHEKVNRREACIFNAAVNETRAQKDVVAFSHRFGGWTGFKWTFNQDITFHIGSNFGYGSYSYLHSIFKYKDIQLAPLSYYVKYKNSDIASVRKCTYQYPVCYNSWKPLMEDCIKFYNAIRNNDINYLFRWIKNELDQLVNGLEHILNHDFAYFSTSYSFNERNYAGYLAKLTGDDYWVIKSKKIAHCLEFVEDIAVLPINIDKGSYIERLKTICINFAPKLQEKINESEDELNKLIETKQYEESDEDFKLYKRIKEKYYWKKDWYKSSEKTSMCWFLLGMLRKINPNYNFREIRERLARLQTRIELINDLTSKCDHLERLKSSLKSSMNEMKGLLEDN